jgi:hypothetical protein
MNSMAVGMIFALMIMGTVSMHWSRVQKGMRRLRILAGMEEALK